EMDCRSVMAGTKAGCCSGFSTGIATRRNLLGPSGRGSNCSRRSGTKSARLKNVSGACCMWHISPELRLERNRDFQQTIAARVPLSFTYDPKVSSFETWMRRFVPYREAATRRVHRAALSGTRSEEHTSELQSPDHLVCRLLLEKKKKKTN